MKRTAIKSSLGMSMLLFLVMLSACKKDNPAPVLPTPTLTFATSPSLTCSTGCLNAATSSVPDGGVITYSISDLSVATVNATTGAITPVASGNATVTATQAAKAGKNNEATASYTLTIVGLSIISFDPAFGGVGYNVVITGTNFDGTTAANNVVKINGVQTATPTNISATSLTVLVPKGATGAGDITVTVGGKTASKGKFTEYATVTTLAGDGKQGWLDATGLKAEFFTPAGLAIDNAGNLLVADYANNRIRSVTTTNGIVTTIAGNGSYDYQDGVGENAYMNEPWGIVVDRSSGLVYVSDRGDDHVRTVNLSSNTVGTIAGTSEGNQNGNSLTDAQFDQPRGIAIDPSTGNLFVADRWYSLIREINVAGYVITLAGTGNSGHVDDVGNNAEFYFPDGVVYEPTGKNLFVADYTNHCIRKVTLDGIVNVSTFAGSTSAGSTDGTGSAAKFSGPSGIAIDADGNLYVADLDNNLIRKITPTGVVTTIAGMINPGDAGYLDGLGPFAKIYQPSGIAVDTDGTIYVSDGTNRIRKIVP